MKTFLKSQFEVQGTEVESTNIYADMREKSLWFAVCNNFDVKKYAQKHSLLFVDTRVINDCKFDIYKAKIGNYSIHFDLEYVNGLPTMARLTAYYIYKTN